MPTNAELYGATGAGATYLPHPLLTFLTTSDPVLGSTNSEVPDGPFNRELHKLLKNDSALANLFVNYLVRTYGVNAVPAHEVGLVPSVLAGAPTTPANLAQHAVFYSDFEVLYRYDGDEGEWLEVSRMERVYNTYRRYFRKLTYTLEDNETDIVVSLPTTDSNDTEFEFTLDDLKTFYINNLNEESGIISVLPAIVAGESTFRVVASEAPTNGSDYELVCIFEHIATL